MSSRMEEFVDLYPIHPSYIDVSNKISVIETRGGKVSGSVSAKTNFLINNDTQSSSSKNQKAKQLNIPIISEQEFINMIS